ncbi:unnamed protein product, partial [Symbiodinium sp. CCMP2456]
MSAWEDEVVESLDFEGINHAEIYTGGNLVNELRRYDQFLRDYVRSDPSATLPAKIMSGKEISNTRIRNWANFQAPPMVLTFVCAGKLDTATRVREIFRAWIMASPPDYQAKGYGDILRIFMRASGALRHLAGDRSGEFVHICEHFIDPAVIEDEARLAAGELEKDLSGIRLNLDTPAIDVVQDQNFYSMNVMLHGGSSAPMNIHDLALLLRRIPENADYPLVFAANSLQAFNVCGYVLYSYVNWGDRQAGEVLYPWTNNILREHGVTVQQYIVDQLENVLKDQRSNGLQLPESFFSCAWNQLRIEGGYADASLERIAVIESWETEFQAIEAPEPLVVGDG